MPSNPTTKLFNRYVSDLFEYMKSNYDGQLREVSFQVYFHFFKNGNLHFCTSRCQSGM